MENASKALIIAGEMLIAILVIGLLVYINILFGKFSSNMNKQMSESQIYEFNNKFYVYSGRYNITVTEIASMINLAKQTNDANQLDRTNTNSPYYIDVKIDKKSFFTQIITNDNDYNDAIKFKDKLNDYINNNNKKCFTCNCNVNVVDSEIRVTQKSDDIGVETITNLVKSINFNSVYDYSITNINDYTVSYK